MRSSASIRATYAPRQWMRPVVSAATNPVRGVEVTTMRASAAAAAAAIAGVASSEPSSTTTHSQSRKLCRRTLASAAGSVAPASRAGRSTETRGARTRALYRVRRRTAPRCRSRGFYIVPARMERLAAWLVRHPRRVVVATMLATAVLGVFAVRIRIQSSLENVLPAGDPAVAFYDEVRRQFGSDDVGVVGVLADDVFSVATVEKIARVTSALAALPGVQSVLSITNMKDVAADVFNPPLLLARTPPSPEDVAALRAKLAAVPLYRENLVSADGRGAAINVVFKQLSDAQYADLDLDGRIAHVLAEAQGPERFYYTSAAHVKRAAVDLMRHDIMRFTPIAFVVVVFSLWLSFRTKRGVLLPLVAVSIALVWTLGVLVLAGRAITLGTFVLPPLLLVVGSSYAIHVMARYYDQSEEGTERVPVVERAYARVWVPLAISVLVTVIGFGSLMVIRIPAIWELGAFAVVGVLFLTATTLFALPAALALMPVERVARRARGGTPLLDRLLGTLAWAAPWPPRRFSAIA